MRAYLELARPANALTAPPDVIAGFALGSSAVAGSVAFTDTALAGLGLAAGASALLYAGGVALNDLLDRHVDALERPERPLPSGRATVRGAAILVAAAYAGALALAALAGPWVLALALAVLAASVAYDAWAKRTGLLGPPVMGLARGLNLLLGAAVAGAAGLAAAAPFALLPLAYVAGVTLVSTGEVRGGMPARNALGVGLALLAPLALTGLALSGAVLGSALVFSLPHLLVLAWTVLPVLTDPGPMRARRAVRSGVLSLTLLAAALAAGASGIPSGLAALVFAPLAITVAEAFQVT